MAGVFRGTLAFFCVFNELSGRKSVSDVEVDVCNIK